MTLPSQNLLPFPSLQFFDQNGKTLAAGAVYTYDADGLTPKTTYADPYGNSANTNPIELDGAGRAVIYGTGEYVWRVEDSLGNVQYTQPTADPTDILQISPAMLPVIQATTTAAALALLGGASLLTSLPIGIGPLPWPNATAPSGWLLCYGQEIDRTVYAGLFAVIGTEFGAGNGSTTFNVPDCRGRVMPGADAMGGAAANRLTTDSIGTAAVLGATGGDQMLTSHDHPIIDVQHSHSDTQAHNITSGTNDSGPLSTTGAGGTTQTGNVLAAFSGLTITDTRGEGTSQNVQPVLVVNYIILTGVA